MPSRSAHDWFSCAPSRPAVTRTTERIRTSDRSCSIHARNGGPGEVRAENRAEVLTGARTADGAPLAHADAMPVAQPSNRQPCEPPVGRADDLGRKIRTVENLATRRAEHITNVDAPKAVPPDRRLDPERSDATRGRLAIDGDTPHVAHG